MKVSNWIRLHLGFDVVNFVCVLYTDRETKRIILVCNGNKSRKFIESSNLCNHNVSNQCWYKGAYDFNIFISLSLYVFVLFREIPEQKKHP